MDRKKILIIDDDLDQRRGLSVRLRANNYETVFGMSDETTRGTRILLIEDEPAFVRLIQVFLGHTAGSQFEIFHVDRLSKGLERLAAGGIDLVLLDLSLPDSWGYETLAKIQPHIHQVPIVVLTGLDDETLAVRAVQEGAQDYLPKASVNAALLVRSVQYAMERHRIKEELHLTGLTLTDKPEVFGLPDYGQPVWEPLWELINDLQIPIDFHIGAGMKTFVLEDFSWGSFGPQRKLASIATLMYMSNAYMVNCFMLSGLFDRYPNLKLVSVESGCGWVPFVIEAAEYQWDEMAPDEAKELKRRPAEYFKDHIYATFWFEDFGVKHFIESIGANNLLFETDFPHPTCLYPESQEHLAKVLQRLDPSVRLRVCQDNAVELYKLPLPA